MSPKHYAPRPDEDDDAPPPTSLRESLAVLAVIAVIGCVGVYLTAHLIMAFTG